MEIMIFGGNPQAGCQRFCPPEISSSKPLLLRAGGDLGGEKQEKCAGETHRDIFSSSETAGAVSI